VSALQVAVTGLGVVSPHGADAGAMFDALMRGESAVQTVFPELPKPTAAALAPFDAARWFTKLQLAGVDRVSQLAVAAAELAVQDAGALGDADPERIGVYAGCGMGGAAALEAAYGSANARVPPLTIPAFMPNAPAAQVAMRRQAQGPVLTYSVACASSGVAIAEAAKAVQRGEVDIAIAGGSEALVVPGVVLAWQAMMTLAGFQPGEAAQAVKPFAADRSGFALGEGAAFLVLESAAGAAARGARVLATVLGHGAAFDPSQGADARSGAGAVARAVRSALAQAGLEAEDVSAVSAAASGHPRADDAEARGLAAALGMRVASVPVTAPKGVLGECLGASGALQAAAMVAAMEAGELPGVAGFAAAAPGFPLWAISNDTTAVDITVGLVDGVGLDGPCCALLLGKG